MVFHMVHDHVPITTGSFLGVHRRFRPTQTLDLPSRNLQLIRRKAKALPEKLLQLPTGGHATVVQQGKEAAILGRKFDGRGHDTWVCPTEYL